MENRFHRSAKRASMYSQPLLVLAPSRHYPSRLPVKPLRTLQPSPPRDLSKTDRLAGISLISFHSEYDGRSRLVFPPGVSIARESRGAIFLCVTQSVRDLPASSISLFIVGCKETIRAIQKITSSG